jgi:hypothetical protein
MHRFNIAIKWPNGDVEGITGFGFDLESAERNAYKEADSKAMFIKQSYEVVTKDMLNVEECFQIKDDWSTYD